MIINRLVTPTFCVTFFRICERSSVSSELIHTVRLKPSVYELQSFFAPLLMEVIACTLWTSLAELFPESSTVSRAWLVLSTDSLNTLFWVNVVTVAAQVLGTLLRKHVLFSFCRIVLNGSHVLLIVISINNDTGFVINLEFTWHSLFASFTAEETFIPTSKSWLYRQTMTSQMYSGTAYRTCQLQTCLLYTSDN